MSFPTGWWKYGIRGVSRMISTHKSIPMGKWWSMDYHANLGVETAITPKDPKRVTPIGAIFIGQRWKEATPNFSHPARCWEASCGTSIRRSCSGVWSLCRRAPGRKAWEFISRKGDLTIISVVKLDMKLIWVVSNVRHPLRWTQPWILNEMISCVSQVMRNLKISSIKTNLKNTADEEWRLDSAWRQGTACHPKQMGCPGTCLFWAANEMIWGVRWNFWQELCEVGTIIGKNRYGSSTW